MELEHKFTVAAPVERAWDVLLDLERVAPCMPGAALTSYDGDDFAGEVRVKIGPVTMTFAGTGRFVTRDPDARLMVIEASGKDRRGGGTARATVRAQLSGEDGSTDVAVHTDLVITGRAAQFGRGMIGEVSNRLLGQFTDCLAGKLAGTDAPAVPAARPADAGATVAPTPPAATASDATASDASAASPAAPAAAPIVAPTPASARVAPTDPTAPAPGPSAARQSAAPQSQARSEVEPIDLLAVTGIRAATARFVPFVLAFLAGAIVGGGVVALLTR